MKILLDTCVVLDFLQKRKPFNRNAHKIFRLFIKSDFGGYVTAKSVTDVYYLMHKFTHNNATTRESLQSLLSVVSIIDTTSEDINNAFSSPAPDFEDAILIESAIRSKMDCIVTRNLKDFSGARIAVHSPDEFLKSIS